MSEPMSPSIGMGVLHLFCKPTPSFDRQATVNAVKEAESGGLTVITVSMLGHKCDLAFMALANDLRDLRKFQSAVQKAGLDVVDSYVSLTEVSEYAVGVPQEMLDARLYPKIPVPGKNAFCFYPMSKRRNVDANWFTLPFEERLAHMQEHGHSGRKFGPRVTQLVTGSTGLDDYEWGVSLFAVHPDDLKEVVYTMRFDQASAVYADFGPFYTGVLTPIDELVDTI
jgi:peroxiredoxin